MKSRYGMVVLTLLLATLPAAGTLAETHTIARTTEAPGSQQAWLGVTLAPVPKALAHQLGKPLSDGQGVLVEAVSPNSPAARAGIRPWDILLAVDGQKLYSAQQLAALVRGSKPGSKQRFELLRQGERQTIDVELGSSPTLSSNQPGWRAEPPLWPGHRPWRLLPPEMAVPGIDRPGTVHLMEQFEAISIRKLGEDHYRAEIEYLDDNGEKRKFSVEGSYDEVRQRIADNPDLPTQRKHSLLNALKTNPDVLLPDAFGGFPVMPPLPRMFERFFHDPDSWF